MTKLSNQNRHYNLVLLNVIHLQFHATKFGKNMFRKKKEEHLSINIISK